MTLITLSINFCSIDYIIDANAHILLDMVLEYSIHLFCINHKNAHNIIQLNLCMLLFYVFLPYHKQKSRIFTFVCFRFLCLFLIQRLFTKIYENTDQWNPINLQYSVFRVNRMANMFSITIWSLKYFVPYWRKNFQHNKFIPEINVAFPTPTSIKIFTKLFFEKYHNKFFFLNHFYGGTTRYLFQ